MQLATWSTGPDSIGWSPDQLPSDPRWCITPPPFGKQCTLLRTVALAACLQMPSCVALTCPDPAESHIGRKPGVTGPICQARSVRIANERRHGMCKPGGCLNVLLRRRRMAGAQRDALVAALNRSLAFRALVGNRTEFVLLVLQPKPPPWLTSSLHTPPFETAKGTAFVVAGGLGPRLGERRRTRELEL